MQDNAKASLALALSGSWSGDRLRATAHCCCDS